MGERQCPWASGEQEDTAAMHTRRCGGMGGRREVEGGRRRPHPFARAPRTLGLFGRPGTSSYVNVPA